MQIGIYDMKARLSELINKLDEEGEIVITSRGKPVAKLVLYEDSPPRPLGLLQGKYTVPKDIDFLNNEVSEMFEVL